MKFSAIILVILFSLSLAAQETQVKHRITLTAYEFQIYPPIARAARVTGKVPVEILVNPDGSPSKLTALSGHPFLKASALEAAKAWRFHCHDCKAGETYAAIVDFGFELVPNPKNDCTKRFIFWKYFFPESVTVVTLEPCTIAMSDPLPNS